MTELSEQCRCKVNKYDHVTFCGEVLLSQDDAQGRKIIPVPHCQPQIPQYLRWEGIKTSAVGNMRQND